MINRGNRRSISLPFPVFSQLFELSAIIYSPRKKELINHMNKKAFLGMGLLGSAFTRAMVKRGDRVKIWNRTMEKAEKLGAEGIEVCATPGEAVKGVSRIHLALRDDASVDEVLQAAATHLEPGAIIIDHTTTTKEGAVTRTRYWKEKGFTYQHTPVFMGPANALEASGAMLISGDQEIAKLLEP